MKASGPPEGARPASPDLLHMLPVAPSFVVYSPLTLMDEGKVSKLAAETPVLSWGWMNRSRCPMLC